MKYTLVITQECNLDCTYCYEHIKEKKSFSENSIADVISFISGDQKKNRFMIEKNISIVFNGGEALIEFELIKKFYFALKEIGVTQFSLSTNLTLMNEDMMDFLYSHGIILHISLDGVKEIHDKNRKFINGAGTFDIVYQKITKLINLYPNWNNSYNITFTPETVNHLYESFCLILNLGIRRITAAYCSDYEWSDEAIQSFSEQMNKIGNVYIDYYSRGERLYFKLLSDSIRYTVFNRKAKCGACIDEIAILPSGELLPCGVFTGQEDYKDYVIGNLKTGVINEKVEGLFISRTVDDSDCVDCSLKSRCHTECYGSNQRVSGNIYSIPESACLINKTSLMEADRVIEYLFSNKNELFMQDLKNAGIPCC